MKRCSAEANCQHGLDYKWALTALVTSAGKNVSVAMLVSVVQTANASDVDKM